jgi:DNA ligase 1
MKPKSRNSPSLVDTVEKSKSFVKIASVFYRPHKLEQEDSKVDVKNTAKAEKIKTNTSELIAQNCLNSNDYDPSKRKYHPIKDAFWQRGDKVPYSALAKTFEFIENTSGRLKTIEMLSNFLRSVIVLSPGDFLACIYLCLNQFAPAYEGLELGIAEHTLMKAIAQSTGRSITQIKADAATTGDLGIVAEKSRSSQKMMFTPAALTVQTVFTKLKEITMMKGTAVSTFCFHLNAGKAYFWCYFPVNW